MGMECKWKCGYDAGKVEGGERKVESEVEYCEYIGYM